MIHRKIKIFLILIIITSTAYSMSFFSSAPQGLGMRQYITNVKGMGMGGTGLALPNFTSLNAYNVSLWRYIGNTKATALMRYDVNQTSLVSEKFTSSTGNFSGVQLAVPIKKYKWVMGLSFTPYTLVDFTYTNNLTNISQPYEEIVVYRGSISKTQINMAWSLNRRVGIGASFNYYIGTILDRYSLGFNNPEYYDNALDINYRFSGPGFSLSSDISVTDSLFLGGFVDFKPSINLVRSAYSPTAFSTEETSVNSTFPLNFGGGISYSFAKFWTVSADYVFQKWSQGFDLEKLNLDLLEDWNKFGIGLEQSHSWARHTPFLRKFDKRIGFSAGNIGYKFNNKSVKEYTLHLGMGVPFNMNRARFDFAFLAGIRGNKNDNLAQEKFFRFLVSISAGELWFQKLR